MSFEIKGKGFGNSGGGFGKAKRGFNLNGDNPLDDVEYTGYLDEDLHGQLTALQKGFEERSKKEKDRYKKATDPAFWFSVYFGSREEKQAFLRAMNLRPALYGEQYIDGRKWAKQEGIELPED